MIQKICPFCRQDSYSSYDDPNWRCPYCGRVIGDFQLEEALVRKRKQISALSDERISSYSFKRIRKNHLKVVDCQAK